MKGRSSPKLPYFGRSDAIAAFTRFDERQPVAWASKVPIKVDEDGSLWTYSRSATVSAKGPVSHIVRNQVQL